MTEQLVLRLGIVFIVIFFMLLGTFFVSIFFYKLTAGRIYQNFTKQPKRFLLTSFIMSLLFAILSIIPDLLDIILAPIIVEPVVTNEVIVLAAIQFLLIIILGGPLVWLSEKYGILLAHKIFCERQV